MTESLKRLPVPEMPVASPGPAVSEAPVRKEGDEGFIERLRRMAEKMGSASELARQAGISGSGFQKYLGGAEPTRKVLLALAQAARVDLQWLMTGAGSMEPNDRVFWPENHLTLLPLFRESEPRRLGDVIDAEDIATHLDGDPRANCDVTARRDGERLVQLAFCREWLGKHGFDPAHLATLRVGGNSMEPSLRSGDTLVVDCSDHTIVDGDIYVIGDAGHLFIKRLQRQLGGQVKLISDNALYPPIDAIESNLNILGKVIWRGALLC